MGLITKITDSTRSSDTAAASAEAPDKDRISPASKACAAAMRAKDAVTAVDEMTAPKMPLTRTPRLGPSVRTAM